MSSKSILIPISKTRMISHSHLGLLYEGDQVPLLRDALRHTHPAAVEKVLELFDACTRSVVLPPDLFAAFNRHSIYFNKPNLQGAGFLNQRRPSSVWDGGL